MASSSQDAVVAQCLSFVHTFRAALCYSIGCHRVSDSIQVHAFDSVARTADIELKMAIDSSDFATADFIFFGHFNAYYQIMAPNYFILELAGSFTLPNYDSECKVVVCHPTG